MSGQESLANLFAQIVPTVLGEQYGMCACATVVYFDYFLTLQQELELVWASAWTPGKVLFLAIRYSGLIATCVGLYIILGSNVPTYSCRIWMYFFLSSNCFTYSTTGILLALRTWALWNKHPLTFLLVSLSWLGAAIAGIVCTVYSIAGIEPFANGFSLLGCLATDTTEAAGWTERAYALGAAYEGVIFVMTVARGIYHLSTPSPMIVVLYRDALLASALLFGTRLPPSPPPLTPSIRLPVFLGSGVLGELTAHSAGFSVANTLLTYYQSPTFYATYFISLSFSYTIPCRIILNLRATASERLDGWDVVTPTPGTRGPSGSERSWRLGGGSRQRRRRRGEGERGGSTEVRIRMEVVRSREVGSEQDEEQEEEAEVDRRRDTFV